MRASLLKVDPLQPEPAMIRQAAATLKRGGLVAFPTETVYGLGANLNDPQAIQELYFVKQRPFDKKVTLLISDRRNIEQHGGQVSELARCLMERFWPGPLTLVVGREDGSTIGFRMPDHPVALALLREADVPVVAPSANLSGQPPARSAEDVVRDFKDKIDCILDSGETPLGQESTVVDVSGKSAIILRAAGLAEPIRQFIEDFERTSVS